jgi:RsiW-degrading membrane proteinase PrsW (M82 family)
MFFACISLLHSRSCVVRATGGERVEGMAVGSPHVGFLRIVALAWLALTCLACGRPLGTNDLVLEYGTAGTPPSNLESLASARLAAAEITAEVTGTREGVRVVVDRDSSGVVDRLLAWPGGLDVYELVPDAKVAATHERALTTEDGSAAGTVIVRETDVVDLHDAVLSAHVGLDGRSLEVRLSPEGDARIAKALPELAATAAHAEVSIAIALDREALYVGSPAALVSRDGELTFHFGDDLEAYARARAARLVLATPPLPALTRVSALASPPDYALAFAALGLPFVLSLSWLFFVRRFDRAQPEPWWLVVATFALGGVSLVPAALVETGWARLSPWLNPSLATLGGRIVALPLALPVFVLVIGVSEEGAKLLGAWSLAFRRREFDEPIDGIVYGSASSLGFAAIENVKYFALGRLGAGLVATRMFVRLPAHLFFGAIWGYALGQKLVRPRTSILAFLALAALAHGAFDAFLSIEGLAPLAFVLNLGLATTFVAVLRRALRHGVVTEASSRVDPAHRSLHPVGSRFAFFASVIALHLVAGVLFVSATYAQVAHWHVGPALICTMSALFTLLAVAAYFISTTLPLDAVVDDYGITFAGAARPWGTGLGVHSSGRGLRVRSTGGDVWIGPAGKAALADLANEIRARLPSPAA